MINDKIKIGMVLFYYYGGGYEEKIGTTCIYTACVKHSFFPRSNDQRERFILMSNVILLLLRT
jgi:hypothetical protein